MPGWRKVYEYNKTKPAGSLLEAVSAGFCRIFAYYVLYRKELCKLSRKSKK